MAYDDWYMPSKRILIPIIAVCLYAASFEKVKADWCGTGAYCPDGAEFSDAIRIKSCWWNASYCVEETETVSAICRGGSSSCDLNYDVGRCFSYQDGYVTKCARNTRESDAVCCRSDGTTPPPGDPGDPPPTTDPSCTVYVSAPAGPHSTIVGQDASFTVSTTESNGTVSKITIGPDAGTTINPTTINAKTGTFTLNASTQGRHSIGLSATVSGNGKTRTCAGGFDVYTAPLVNVTAQACLSTNNSTCAGCPVPTVDGIGTFEGTMSLTGSANATANVSGNTVATLSPSVYGYSGRAGSAPSYNLTLTSSVAASQNWFVISPGVTNIGQATTVNWTTQNNAYGPYGLCVGAIYGPWWQVSGGDVLSLRGAINSTVPASVNTATRYVSRKHAVVPGQSWAGGIMDSGVPIAAGTGAAINVSIGSIGGPWREDAATSQWKVVQNSGFSQQQQKYEDLKKNYAIASWAESFGAGTQSVDLINLNSIAPTNDAANKAANGNVYYHAGDLIINNTTAASTVLNWASPNNKNTIFVAGNVFITSSVLIEEGDFLAVIASGNIYFNSGSTDVNGVFISDGSIIIDNNNGTTTNRSAVSQNTNRFVARGTLVGWTGVTMTRTFPDKMANNTNPAITFVYRPDFMVNAPDGFKTAAIEWQEVDPVKM